MTDFEARRVTYEFTPTNDAPPDRVFPLLCPVREAEWVPDWKYQLIYSQSGFAEEGCVFTTPNDVGPDTVNGDALRSEGVHHRLRLGPTRHNRDAAQDFAHSHPRQ